MCQPWAAELRFVGGTSAELHVHWPRLGRRPRTHAILPGRQPARARAALLPAASLAGCLQTVAYLECRMRREVWASPGFVDTPNRTKSAIGVSHGEEAAAAIVLAGVQGGSDQGGAGEREECQHRGA